MATQGAQITKTNFNTSWSYSLSGTNPGANGTFFYVCAPAFRVNTQTRDRSGISQKWAQIYHAFYVFNGTSWTSAGDYTTNRNSTYSRHLTFAHNLNLPDDETARYFMNHNGENHLYEVFLQRVQGEGDKTEWEIYAGGIGMMVESAINYNNIVRGNPIYGIGSSSLIWNAGSSQQRAAAISRFNTALKRGSPITAAQSEFCTWTKTGE